MLPKLTEPSSGQEYITHSKHVCLNARHSDVILHRGK